MCPTSVVSLLGICPSNLFELATNTSRLLSSPSAGRVPVKAFPPTSTFQMPEGRLLRRPLRLLSLQDKKAGYSGASIVCKQQVPQTSCTSFCVVPSDINCITTRSPDIQQSEPPCHARHCSCQTVTRHIEELEAPHAAPAHWYAACQPRTPLNVCVQSGQGHRAG